MAGAHLVPAAVPRVGGSGTTGGLPAANLAQTLPPNLQENEIWVAESAPSKPQPHLECGIVLGLLVGRRKLIESNDKGLRHIPAAENPETAIGTGPGLTGQGAGLLRCSGGHNWLTMCGLLLLATLLATRPQRVARQEAAAGLQPPHRRCTLHDCERGSCWRLPGPIGWAQVLL